MAPLLHGCEGCPHTSALCTPQTDRRSLLRASTGLAILAALPLSACGGSSVGEAADAGDGDGLAGDADSDAAIRAPDANCAPTCGTSPTTTALIFTAHPSLARVGGSVVFQLPGYSDPVCGLDLVIVVQPKAGEFVAFSAACTHACCPVSYQASTSRLVCPCHGSVYDLSGNVVAGPAPRGLTPLRVCSDGCGVYVTG